MSDAPAHPNHIDAEEFISLIYKAFDCFRKPEHSTDFSHCEECREHDETLMFVTRENLSVREIGTVCWGVVAFLTPEAMSYYLPRMMELAILGVPNKENLPYITQFLIQIGLHNPRDKQYSLLGDEHKNLLHSCLCFIKSNHWVQIEEECCEDFIEKSITNWKPCD